MKTVKMEVEEEMDKRSFIRGFGMGVLFAAVILGISCLMRTEHVLKKSMSRLSQASSLRIPAEVSSSCLTVR